jgi:tRNA A37 threonylcarbamoyladenosine synthetase subunit TsaC/SUA5/YrdC
MFITSTSRLVLPVNLCTLLPGLAPVDGQTVFPMPQHPLVARLAQAVKDDLKTGSRNVADEPHAV